MRRLNLKRLEKKEVKVNRPTNVLIMLTFFNWKVQDVHETTVFSVSIYVLYKDISINYIIIELVYFGNKLQNFGFSEFNFIIFRD